MRSFLVWSIPFVAACAAAPPPSSPAIAAPVVSSVAPPAPAPTAAPRADEGPPPQPPMAMRWTHHLPSVAGRPWSEQYLKVTEEGEASWEASSGGGDGDLDETLQPAPNAGNAAPAVRCRGRVGPGLHRRLVEAARRAMTVGCTAKAAPVDAATTTLAVTWEGDIKSCNVARSGGGYAAFEQVRSEVVSTVCQGR